VRGTFGDQRTNRQPGECARSEVAGQQPAQPAEVPLGERPVQPELGAQLRQPCGIGGGTERLRGRVTGQHLDGEEQPEADGQQEHEGRRQRPQDRQDCLHGIEICSSRGRDWA
jgi:hypothetical protein